MPIKNPQSDPGDLSRFALLDGETFESGTWAAMSGSAKGVYAVLRYHDNQSRRSWPSIRTIAELSGCSRGQVSRAIAELIKLGVVVREQTARARGQQTIYRTAAQAQQIGDGSDQNRPTGATATVPPAQQHCCASAPELLRPSITEHHHGKTKMNNKSGTSLGRKSSLVLHDDEGPADAGPNKPAADAADRLREELPDDATPEQIIAVLKSHGVHSGRAYKRVVQRHCTPVVVREAIARVDAQPGVRNRGAYLGDVLDEAIQQAEAQDAEVRRQSYEAVVDQRAQAVEAIKTMPDDALLSLINATVEQGSNPPDTTVEHVRNFAVARTPVVNLLLRQWASAPTDTPTELAHAS